MHRLVNSVPSCARAVAMLAGVASAQTADKRTLTIDGAKKAAAAAVAEAKKNNEGGVIAVVDDGGNLMYLERVEGTSPPAPGSPSARRAPQRSSGSLPRCSRKSSATAARP